jgi:hypothetical protein
MLRAGDIHDRQHVPGESLVQPDKAAAAQLLTADASTE